MNKEELREKIVRGRKIVEAVLAGQNNSPEYYEGKLSAIKTILNLIDQLDEPETLSPDWIKDNQLIWASAHGVDYYVPSDKLYGQIVPKQEESEKVVVPAFVGEWYKKESRDLNRAIYHLCNDTARMHHTAFDDFKKWFVNPVNNSIETLIKMQNGFTVEEKKYRVQLTTLAYLTTDQDGELHWFDSEPWATDENVWWFTEDEIKEVDPRYWPFAVPVEE